MIRGMTERALTNGKFSVEAEYQVDIARIVAVTKGRHVAFFLFF
jgi:hypothetical protein